MYLYIHQVFPYLPDYIECNRSIVYEGARFAAWADFAPQDTLVIKVKVFGNENFL